jgi:predicted O-methyltransferase YrrM
MVRYDLSHLTQDDTQRVLGPIQDDEALFLYALIRGNRMSRVLELGGLTGYSASNFLAALGCRGMLYTVDVNPVPVLASNHIVIVKNALDLESTDVGSQPLDLVFFDCHDMVQMQVFERFLELGLITDETVLALHDTNLHYPPFQVWGPFVAAEGGFAHQPVEREMVNLLRARGYDCFSIRTTKERHSEAFPFRHGLTVCQRFRTMKNS